MCIQEPTQDMEENTQTETWQKNTSNPTSLSNSPPLESICENTVSVGRIEIPRNSFLPTLRFGEWSDIGERPAMEDSHICIQDLTKSFGHNKLGEEPISFYGVFDGHGGKAASQFVRDNLPQLIVKDVDFPLELEKVVTRSFKEIDAAIAKSCSLESSLCSGTTALAAMIYGRSLLVANVGDCRAVLSRYGLAIEMSKDHKPCCKDEIQRIESSGGYVDDGYLNGQLGVTRALGDWHIKGLNKALNGGPLSGEPEFKLITLTREDEFLILASDGIWDVFMSQNAVDFARRRLQEHNNVKLCCEEIVDEAKKRSSIDNLTVIVICFHSDAPPPSPAQAVQRTRVRKSLSAESLQNLKFLLEE